MMVADVLVPNKYQAINNINWLAYIIMMVADVLAPNRCQVISNYLIDLIMFDQYVDHNA